MLVGLTLLLGFDGMRGLTIRPFAPVPGPLGGCLFSSPFAMVVPLERGEVGDVDGADVFLSITLFFHSV